ncbi:MAG: PAC2 family protein [Ilumatobacteraceae bacterium]
MADYRLHERWPELASPTLVFMLTGWIDASGAAAGALQAVDRACETRPLATFDGDTFIDYRARRPTMELRDGVNTRLEWPDIVLRVGRDARGHDVLTLGGPEPDAQWRRFAAGFAELAVGLGVTQAVGFGAYPFATPHTRAPRLSCTSPSPELAASLPFLKSSVDVPAGMGAVLEHALFDQSVPATTIWAQVPHYVSTMAYPAATVALLAGLRDVAHIDVDDSDLVANANAQRTRLDELVAANDEHVAMLRQLERAFDTASEETLGLGSTDLPSGDELAAELERFLREQGQGQ